MYNTIKLFWWVCCRLVYKRVRPVAYHLALWSHLRKIPNGFHVVVLSKYVLNPSHVLKLEGLQVSKEWTIQVQPFSILYKMVRQLGNHILDQVRSNGISIAIFLLPERMQRLYVKISHTFFSKFNFKTKFPKGGAHVVP